MTYFTGGDICEWYHCTDDWWEIPPGGALNVVQLRPWRWPSSGKARERGRNLSQPLDIWRVPSGISTGGG